MPLISEKLQEWFWSQVYKLPGDSCWLWQGTLRPSGHGQLWIAVVEDEYEYDIWPFKLRPGNKITIAAHRFILCVEEYVSFSTGLAVFHRCGNPPCVRPGHLFFGEHNLRKRGMGGNTAKTRSRCLRPIRKLTDEVIALIAEDADVSPEDIEYSHGIPRRTVEVIRGVPSVPTNFHVPTIQLFRHNVFEGTDF